MKKLMIAAAIVCAAVASQASTALWNVYTSVGGEVKSPVTGLITGDVYVYQLGAITQDDVLEQFRKDGSFLTGYVKTDKATAGVFNTNFSTQEEGASAQFFLAATDGSNILLLDALTGNVNIQTPTGIAFDAGWMATYSEPIIGADVKFSDRVSSVAYGDGWYAAGAVPEPTSGLLLLLGVAGLALRRRRA